MYIYRMLQLRKPIFSPSKVQYSLEAQAIANLGSVSV